jgi:Domain of unknown function (DUF4214)
MSRSEKSGTRRFFRPSLENLEDRTTPAAYQMIATFPASQSTGTFLQGLYENTLDRPPDPSGLAFWTQQMKGGITKVAVATTFWTGTEHRSLEIDLFYNNLLGRDVDSGGLAFFLNQFQTGGNEISVQRNIILTPEFVGGSTSPTVYVNNLYTNLLGRQPDQFAAQWITSLQMGQTRIGVAQLFLTGSEAITDVVTTYYANIFNRTASKGELQGWVSSIINGFQNYQTVAVTFFNSPEYAVNFP